jgi:hypothetical protein
VRVFYATVYTAETREYIMFMFQGTQYTLFGHHIVATLGFMDYESGKYEHKPLLHNIIYGDHEPPQCSLLGRSFLSDEQMTRLFVKSFTGT